MIRKCHFFLLLLSMAACNPNEPQITSGPNEHGTANHSPSEPEYRGIVLYPSDLISIGSDQWIDWLVEADINLLGIHTDTKLETLPKLQSYITSSDGQRLLALAAENGIDIEYELHVLQDLLPRTLFDSRPELFRMDENGVRQREYNMCFSEEAAYREIEKSIANITQWLKPTTHRYFFWTDDVQDAFCHSTRDKAFSASEQALIYENRLLRILRKVDPKATVAHLAYHNTLQAPQKVRPAEGVFLEYAPITRDLSATLSEAHIDSIRENLIVFPPETAHVLEYWIDVSKFSNWDRSNLLRIPWNGRQCADDVEVYRSLGVTSITSFGAWINSDYVRKYGLDEVAEQIKRYGQCLRGNVSGRDTES